ncbi:MAG: hypothetical protein AVDCRST_MAG48-590, partial [uncultured Friedmanniella sp.]
MTSTVACPSCGTMLPKAARVCPACGLPLTGSLAAELWRTDQQLVALRDHRDELLRRLRQGTTDGGPPPAAPAPPARAGWSGQQVLLGTGALLVVTAAVVFLAVAWSVIGVAGQVAVMAALTLATAVAAARLARRGLLATAQTLAAVSVGLAVVDLAAAHALDLAGLGRLDEVRYAAGAAAVLALVSTLAARRLPALLAFPLARGRRRRRGAPAGRRRSRGVRAGGRPGVPGRGGRHHARRRPAGPPDGGAGEPGGGRRPVLAAHLGELGAAGAGGAARRRGRA